MDSGIKAWAGCCVLWGCFFGFWTFFSIVGAIHYAVWYPNFDLHDVRIRAFNVTGDSLLTCDMDVVIQARHFSSIRRIERHSYKVKIWHAGLHIGSNDVPSFHPGRSPTKELVSTQRTTLLPMGATLGPLVRRDLNVTGRVALRIDIRGQIYTDLFLAQKKRKRLTCDLIVSPGSGIGDQIYERRCCGGLRCLKICSKDSGSCCLYADNCCPLPPSNVRSTISICG